MSRDDTFAALGIPARAHNLLITIHPETLAMEGSLARLEELKAKKFVLSDDALYQKQLDLVELRDERRADGPGRVRRIVARDRRAGVLVATHDARLATFADRIITIEDGQITSTNADPALFAHHH